MPYHIDHARHFVKPISGLMPVNGYAAGPRFMGYSDEEINEDDKPTLVWMHEFQKDNYHVNLESSTRAYDWYQLRPERGIDDRADGMPSCTNKVEWAVHCKYLHRDPAPHWDMKVRFTLPHIVLFFL
ncbi:hypothetical protein JCM1840_005276 [Sporobolomyces johnsonii]